MLATDTEHLKVQQKEAKKIIYELTQQLTVSRQESQKTKNEFIQKLTNTEKHIKEQLATTCQNLTNAENKHANLAAKVDEMIAKLETKFLTKINEIETTAQIKIAALETKLAQKTEQIDRLFTWNMDITLQASKLSSGSQVVPVIVKMPQFKKKRSGEVHWYSNSFYTHRGGYRMCLKICAAAGWSGTDLSECLFLMTGPYDHTLRWPLRGRCEIKLLNQISNGEHYSKDGSYHEHGHQRVTSVERNAYYMWCNHCFISHQDLRKITPTCQYLKNNSIFLQIHYKLST